MLGFTDLNRSGLTSTAWMLLLIPIRWLLVAWRAAWQLVFAPHFWKKTEHRLARHSRRNERTPAALRTLERALTPAVHAGP